MMANSSIEFHRKMHAKARRASSAVKDPILREIAYHSILRHLYEVTHSNRHTGRTRRKKT